MKTDENSIEIVESAIKIMLFFEHKVGRICDNLQANLYCISIKT